MAESVTESIAVGADSHRVEPASFRDPSGYIYRDPEGRLCRKVQPIYSKHLRQLVESGLYEDLTSAGLLIEHEQGEAEPDGSTVLYPREIPFVSYPYEWSFGMLKEAALLTLKIQERALAHGMILKDASAYNVQFEGAHAVFIDTLSFEPLPDGKPWVAYGQFCRHFLAPLALMSKRDVRLGKMLSNFLDGIPLDLAVKLLPRRAWLNLGLFLHLRSHAKAVLRHQDTSANGAEEKNRSVRVSKKSLELLTEHLRSTISRLRWEPRGTEWVDYYQDNTYDEAMKQEKTRWVASKLDQLRPGIVWDLGANVGLYSRVAREAGAYVVSLDIDPGCVERNFRDGKSRDERRVLPLCLDLTNPSPGLGWAHRERQSLSQRGPADAALALALIHHLAIGNNVPFAMIAQWFASLAKALLIEFVPKDDPQTQRLLASREDIFSEYHEDAFVTAFERHFARVDRCPVPGSGRVLYLFERRGA